MELKKLQKKLQKEKKKKYPGPREIQSRMGNCTETKRETVTLRITTPIFSFIRHHVPHCPKASISIT
jgi:hypothetical protein